MKIKQIGEVMYKKLIIKPYAASNSAAKVAQINILFAAPKNITEASKNAKATSSLKPMLRSCPKIISE